MMAKKRKKKVKGLSGVEAAIGQTKVGQGGFSRHQIGGSVAALAAGGIAGAALFGNHVLIPSLIALGIGVGRKNLYWTMAGAGLFLASGFQAKAAVKPASSTTNGIEDEVNGFDFATYKDQVIERTKNYFSSFAEKLYLPKPKEETESGMNGSGDEVTYFMNPYSTKKGQLDMSKLDDIQAQIAEMNQPVNGVELDASQKNF
jgi:hypothetical protein